MANNIFDIGVSGLNAAQYGLATTSHNIGNASTPGYSRQTAQVTSAGGQYTAFGFLGSGVSVSTVTRQYSDFLNTQLHQAQAQGSALSTYNTQAQQLSSIVGDPTAGMTTALQGFFSGLQTLANDPTSIPARQSALDSAQTLASQFNLLDGQFNQVRSGVNGQLTQAVGQINQYADQIAQLNQQIMLAKGTGQPPNDLLDQRDQAVANLSQLAGASVVSTGDGSYSVFMGTGQSLVVGDQAYHLTTVPTAGDNSEVSVAYAGVGTGGTPQTLSDKALTGGTLGGLLQFRSQTLDPQQAALGTIATALAMSLNQTNAAGLDLNGAAGGALFSLAQPGTAPLAGATGSGALSATYGGDMSQLTPDNYVLSAGAAGAYTLTDTATGTAQALTFTAGGGVLTAQAAGMKLTLTGTMNAGDKIAITSSARSAAGNVGVALTDPRGIAAALPWASAVAASGNTGAASFSVSSVSGALAAPVTITAGAGGLTFSPAQNVTVISGGTSVLYAAGTTPLPPATQGAVYSFGGTSVTLSGAPVAGDSFTIAASSGPSDARNVLAMAGLASLKTMQNGAASFSDAYANFVGQIGSTAQHMQVTSTAQASLVTQVQASQQSVSGVNLDEEAANLLQYQQLYQADSKVIQIASSLFSTLLGVVSA